MKKTFVAPVLAVIALTLVHCKKEGQTADFDAITKEYFKDKNALSPLDATQNGQNEFNGDLQFEMTDAFRKKQAAFYDKYQGELSKVDTTALDAEQKNSFYIMKWETGVGKDLLQYPTNLMPIQQFWGTHLTMAQFAAGTGAQPFKTAKDYNDFLLRMEKYSVWLDSATVYMKKGISKGYVLPKILAEKLPAQFDAMVTDKAENNPFYASIALMPAGIPENTKKDIAGKYAAVINDKLIPEFKKFSAFLKTEYIPAARSTSGYGALPDGDKMYTAYAKMWTTTSMTPAEIHELGLKEVARIRTEMEKVKNEVGYKGTLMDFFNEVRNKKELKPYKKPEEVIAHFEAIYATIKPNVDKLFSLQPKTPFEIRRTEAFREKTASAEYLQGSADGTRPGIFYVPIPDVANYNNYADEDLFLHEAIPGHHFQISLQQENKSLPDFRKFNWFGAYGEGWALYTESLGKELGLYKDPYQYFGMLSNEMHRAIRLVVDTGIHTKNWTREQAIKYSLENEAEPEASIIAEIERYMAIPGQALSYKIGQMKILELRNRAEKAMGPKFDIRVYHQKVLESGVMPLALLEQNIDQWIASVKK